MPKAAKGAAWCFWIDRNNISTLENVSERWMKPQHCSEGEKKLHEIIEKVEIIGKVDNSFLMVLLGRGKSQREK